MKIFIDTADVEAIRRAKAMGFVSGVTTNPSLIAAEGKDFHTVIKEIASIVDGPVSAEVLSETAEAMIADRRYPWSNSIDGNSIIKVTRPHLGREHVYRYGRVQSESPRRAVHRVRRCSLSG